MASLSDIVQPARYIADLLAQKIDKQESILWFVSGGSAKRVAVVAREFLGEIPENVSLNVCLIDERYGLPGHEDSNFKLLMDASFKTDGLSLHPVLNGSDIETTTSEYNALLKRLFKESAYKIALLGIGSDGHTAGILPNSPAFSETDELVTHYKGPDYQRITVTPLVFNLLDEAVIHVRGEDKFTAVKQFLQDDIPETAAPSQLIKKAKHFKLFSDYKEMHI